MAPENVEAIRVEVRTFQRNLDTALRRLGTADEKGHRVADLETLIRVTQRECGRVLGAIDGAEAVPHGS